jgi:hypothetical protein
MNPIRKWAVGGAIGLGSIAGGAIGASFIGTANAATTSSTSTSSTSSTGSTGSTGSSGSAATQTAPSMPAHGTAAHEDAEAAVTGSAATQAQAAAVKSVGSGTAGAVTNDFTHTGYEVTVTKADGSQVEVHLDSSFNVISGPQGGSAAGPQG